MPKKDMTDSLVGSRSIDIRINLLPTGEEINRNMNSSPPWWGVSHQEFDEISSLAAFQPSLHCDILLDGRHLNAVQVEISRISAGTDGILVGLYHGINDLGFPRQRQTLLFIGGEQLTILVDLDFCLDF